MAGVVRERDYFCPWKSVAQRKGDAVAFPLAKPNEDEIGRQHLQTPGEPFASIETGDDVDRRMLGNDLADDVAQQRGYRYRDRPDAVHLIFCC